MKKIIYGFLFALASMTVVTSCTEEEVKPRNEADGTVAGGQASDDIKK
jgi:hypothetical protein